MCKEDRRPQECCTFMTRAASARPVAMRSVAVFSLKGGVGKTTCAVNLAHAFATISGRRTLLWDLDSQAAATFLLDVDARGEHPARRQLTAGATPAAGVQPTTTPGLHLLPADKSLRHLERQWAGESGRTLARLLSTLAPYYDRVVIDCPPGFSTLAEQVFRAVDLVVEPMLPSPLSERTHLALVDHLARHHDGRPPVLPLFSMVDRRRAGHKTAVANHPDRPALPYASIVEAMAAQRAPLAMFAPASPAAAAYVDLVTATERRLIG